MTQLLLLTGPCPFAASPVPFCGAVVPLMESYSLNSLRNILKYSVVLLGMKVLAFICPKKHPCPLYFLLSVEL